MSSTHGGIWLRLVYSRMESEKGALLCHEYIHRGGQGLVMCCGVWRREIELIWTLTSQVQADLGPVSSPWACLMTFDLPGGLETCKDSSPTDINTAHPVTQSVYWSKQSQMTEHHNIYATCALWEAMGSEYQCHGEQSASRTWYREDLTQTLHHGRLPMH